MTNIDLPNIPKFYSGKNIFITGATGFFGKALIEKLLRSCPEIGNIYILVRPKRGKELSERVDILLNDPLYERVKREKPNLQMNKKIIPLAGDVAELNLGLSAKDRQTLIDNIHITFHIAASVRFDDSLKDAVMMNVRGTREACQISLEAKNLITHIHVSTAFANCDQLEEVQEVLYTPKINWSHMIEIAEKFDPNTLKYLTDKFMDGMPNTYCFTKHIAEHVAYDMLNGKKCCTIFRPSIVISSIRDEPVKGWIDNLNGPTGILIAYGKGVLRTLYAHDRYKPDYMTIDVVTKALIVSAWDISVRHLPPLKEPLIPEVIHCTSHNADWLRPNVERLAAAALQASDKYPLNGIMWIPSTHTTNSKFIWYIRTVLFMLLPAIFFDGILKLIGKKPLLIRLQKKIAVAQLALRYFMNNEWDYNNRNLLALQNRILEQDKADWDYDFSHYDFNAYMIDCVLGARRYILNEPDHTLPSAKIHYKRMFYLDKIVKLMGTVLFFWVLWNIGFVQYGFKKIKL